MQMLRGYGTGYGVVWIVYTAQIDFQIIKWTVTLNFF